MNEKYSIDKKDLRFFLMKKQKRKSTKISLGFKNSKFHCYGSKKCGKFSTQEEPYTIY